jgi:hypothetical protein
VKLTKLGTEFKLTITCVKYSGVLTIWPVNKTICRKVISSQEYNSLLLSNLKAYLLSKGSDGSLEKTPSFLFQELV